MKTLKQVIEANDTILMATEFGKADGVVNAVQDKLKDAKETSDAIASAFVGIVPHTHFYSPRVSKPKDGEKAKKPKGTGTIAFYDEHRIANAVGRIKDKQERADFLLSDAEAEATLPVARHKRRRVLIQQSSTWVKRLGDAVKKAERAKLPEDEQEALKVNDDMVKLREQLVAFSKKANKILTEDVYKSIVKDVQNITIKIS